MERKFSDRIEGETWKDYLVRRYKVSLDLTDADFKSRKSEVLNRGMDHLAGAALIGLGLIDIFVPRANIPPAVYALLAGVHIWFVNKSQENANFRHELWTDEVWDRVEQLEEKIGYRTIGRFKDGAYPPKSVKKADS